MASSRPSSTRSISDILLGKNIEMAGVQKKTIGSYEILTGLGTLTALGIHVLATHPHFVVAHIVVSSIGAFLTLDGIVTSQSANEEIAMGQAITEQTLRAPEATYSTQPSVFFFSSDAPPVNTAANTPITENNDTNRLKAG